jgi:polar amino acid transport system permease protein
MGRRSENPWLAQPVGGLVEFVRSTPLLVQLYIFFFVLPRYGLRLPAFIVGTIVLGLHYGTYCSEVYRAGIDAVDRGQWEASRSLNFSPVRTWAGIILPQAIPPMIPALGNYLVAMFKESAQLSAITVVELTLSARIVGTDTFRFLEPFTMAGALYFLISYPSSLFVQRLEARYARKS